MRIGLITSTRADFGLLKNLIFSLKNTKNFNLKIIASGSHFSKKHGNSYEEINENNIKIDYKIKCKFENYEPKKLSKVFSETVEKSSRIFGKFQPEILIVLGDRYEVLASAVTAHMFRIPIAHIHGGEVTEGVIDDAFRHSITKLSHIHFVANKIYKNRVIQLGENPKNVHVVGGLGVDSIKAQKLLSKKDLEKKLNLKFRKKNFIINFHPETINKRKAKIQINELLSSLKKFKNVGFFFTAPGADLESGIIMRIIKRFVNKNKNAFLFKSLGQKNYFSLLKVVDCMIGNSSSGVLEMPIFKKSTVNIGIRQKGREFSKSIISTEIDKIKITKAIKKAISNNFKKTIKNASHPYGKYGATKKILKILKKNKNKKIFYKKFFDLKLSNLDN